MKNKSTKTLVKIIIDVILFLLVALPYFILSIFGSPYKRGFFCNDESLMHPYVESLVSSTVLGIVGLGLPVLLIFIVEITQSKFGKNDEAENNYRQFPIWVLNCYKYVGIFFFGAFAAQLTIEMTKFSVGRLRPHFLIVCQPIMLDGTNCSDPINWHRYIEEFTCGNTEATKSVIRELRLSFPSGHSSLSMFSMAFSALYLQYRMTWKSSKLLKHVLQFAFILMAYFTSLSRIFDYKHHWSDALYGSIQGLVFSIVVIYGVSDLYKKRCLKRNSV